MNSQTIGWLTIDEAAALIRVPKSWLYERTRTNTVPHIKLGKYLRFDKQEFLAWARQFRRDGRGRGAHAARSAIAGRSGRDTRPSLG
jgi:excisionase family DNA binding protein